MEPDNSSAADRREGRKVIAYVMSRFPKISETFILYEILELERLGLRVEVFPLVRERQGVMHAEARAMVERAHYANLLSVEVLGSQLYWLSRHPAAYAKAWWHAIRGNYPSRPFLLRALVTVPLAAHFARRMQALGVEHVHAHWATHPALAAYVIRLLTGLPYSITAHAHDIYVDQTMLEEKLAAASLVVTISDYNRRFLQGLFGDEAAAKTVVIHCGIDPTIFTPSEHHPHDNAPFTIVCVASLQDYKGHPHLIDACARLQGEGIPFRCLLIGEGEERPLIEAQIARLGLQDSVLLLGGQPRDQVSALLKVADVVVLPSVTTSSGKMEGIPVALMEAMAMELPVVATAISGIPELIEHEQSGLLVPERDAGALADALLRLYHTPDLRQRLGTMGRARVLREFNLQENTRRLYDLLLHDWSSEVLTRQAAGLIEQTTAGKGS